MKIYYNLTNGLEFAPPDARLVRIQSTAIEQKLFNKLISELDYDFLFSLARGEVVAVLDATRVGVTKAVYYGIPFIRYILTRYWLNKTIDVVVNTHNVNSYFDKLYRKLSINAKAKLRYVKKFVTTDNIRLIGLCHRTKHDGDYEYYKSINKVLEQ